jgi:nitrite reductase/ring-hydroxylating ferredoxin subunit
MSGDAQDDRQRTLCRIEDIPDGEARGFAPADSGHRSVFAVRRGHRAFVYVNCCPHAGAELEYAQDRFLSADRLRIICFAHNAQFDVETGHCVAGPCLGQALEAVTARIVEGAIIVPADAGKLSQPPWLAGASVE